MHKCAITILAAALTIQPGHGASATLNPDASRGKKIVKIEVPGRQSQEICVIPNHLPDVEYGDKDKKREKALCDMDFYKTVVACPKMNSTNPGLDIHDIPDGSTFEQVTAARCFIKDPNGDANEKKPKNLSKKIAKYKLSTSCSYTPSILGYYHVSRYLGDILNVPVATLRTFDLQNHIALGREALKRAKPGSTIQLTWQSLMKQLTAGANAPRKNFLLTDKADQSYGALLETARHEDTYKEFFNGGKNNLERTANLASKNPIIAKLAHTGPLNIGSEFNAENLQTMVQLRDAANMIVMDTLLSQEDRMGNIHYYETPFIMKDGKLTELTRKQVKKGGGEGAITVKEMLLKDNDCGVSRENLAVKYNLPSKIAHIDPATYKNLLKLNSVADKPETKSFFTTELLFTDADWTKFRKNLGDLSKKLHDACAGKKLSLDLDLQAHFGGSQTAAPSCEL